jgi:hypothetical protein
MHSDGKERRSFLALLFATGDLRRCAAINLRHKQKKEGINDKLEAQSKKRSAHISN